MDHLDIAEPPPTFPEVVRHLEAGNKIQAIKSYRDATGADLKGAKDAVEEIARQRGL
jgi:ribosomal protein L7/L12